MSDLGKVPPRLMEAIGSDLFWGLALSELRQNPSTGEVVIMLPLSNGMLILELGTVPGLSGS